MASREDETIRWPDLWLDPGLADLVRQVAAVRGWSLAEATRTALRLLVWFEDWRSRQPARALPRVCVVCEQPYRGDPQHDAMAHAQCSQILADMDKELVS